MTAIRITGGRVHDPANAVDGEIRDVCVEGGKVVAEVGPHARRIDARGMVVMPGGVDIHAHIAGPKVNAARKLTPDERRDDPLDRTELLRSGTGGLVPSTFATGYRYSLLGYTTVVEAAAPPLAARQVLAELRDTPMIDKAFLILMGNNQVLFELIRESGGAVSQQLRDAVAWWLEATGAYGVKLVNPGGVEVFKQDNGNVHSLDDEVAGFGVTPRQVLEAIGGAVDELGLPHPVHIHANNLGVPGNADTTLETMRTVSGRQAHFAHLQFHCYGGRPGGQPRSRAPELLDYLASHPEITADVGQVMFGPAVTMTADGPLSAVLRDVDGGKWLNHDTEVETGCGIVPYRYRAGSYVHALQWGIGLELFLLGQDPWQVMLSTDHPNGGSFLSYPKLIRLLMDRAFREDQIGRANQRAIRRTALLDGLDREYTLNEIAIITRAAPARRLGLHGKGHLGVGADADVTIYHDRADREEMFATPRYVIKGGELAVEEGELRRSDDGLLLLQPRRVRSRGQSGPRASVRPALHGGVRALSGTRRGAARAGADRGGPHVSAYVLGQTEVTDTFAEAFPMRYARVVITAASDTWAHEAARSMTGFATSVIGCKCEAAIERGLGAEDTPDGRPGIAVLLFAMDREGVGKRILERVGQSVMTCPTTACFDGLPGAERTAALGSSLRYFGDGFQASKVIAGRRFWRIPVMDGEFLVSESVGVGRGVGGGNLVIGAGHEDAALAGAQAAAEAMRGEGIALPFPGGIVRSGSKVGARTSKTMPASTNHQMAPTLRAQIPDSLVPDGVGAVNEIVIDGVSEEAVREAMRRGLHAAAGAGATHVSAVNFGGKLGEFHFPLADLRDPP